jgi:cell volume regulation protein A
LAIILFHGGLHLDFASVLPILPRALLLTLLGFSFSVAAVTAFAYYIMQVELLHGLLLGAIIGGTSSAIVIPMISRVKVRSEVASVLELESAFTDALVIVAALVVLQIITTGDTDNGFAGVAQALGLRFLLGSLVGIAAGILWLCMLTLIEGETYDDIITLAIVFLLFFAVERLGGSGAIFTLAFGMILGNGVKVANWIRIRRTVAVHQMMMKFYSEISFLIKTFFFVYLGLLITFDKPQPLVLGVILAFVLLLSRCLPVLLSTAGSSVLWKNKGILTTMLPRGLAAAVVAEMVIAAGIPNATIYSSIVLAVIVSTVAIAAISIPIFGHQPPPESSEPAPSAEH